ncbi:malonic semialdehyde reductase [Streptomyces subrutilus]|uniref:Malonic semialdehyde reductase n=1 Tax=Streptomyces subrutilus TaxID=36818 RepID=A0A5P2US67_9ACTN|nr:malonic semialdehyde reductase [Streptomyces subrutilus]QEU82162.1 malonic semialdehyde reductase [Streptomyces subrutilus]WSJ28360.1 malonic semialdehyde reductase [Streptomyces subrutilus]GGZ92495.1 putative NADH dehydrogenase/NAD(P)H nitroreductase [Streptomyces subrutilus]
MHPPDPVLRLDEAAQDLLFRQARSADAFTDEPVSDATVEAVHDLVKYGPTAFNQQPLRVVLVRSPESRRRLVGHLARGNREKTARAPLTAVLAVDRDFHTELPRLFPAHPQAADRYYAQRPVREASAVLNGALQAAYFIIGVRAAGLAAGPMSGFDADGVTKEFFTPGRHEVLIVVNIGRPAAHPPRPRGPRLGYGQVFTTV